jgi:two-component system cell cycle sensor histidine kinase/response regulator CckA
VVMPKLGGGDLAKLLALRPGIRVLYMSAYTDGAISQHGVLGAGVFLLEKPFTGDKLARVVREALDRPVRRG